MEETKDLKGYIMNFWDWANENPIVLIIIVFILCAFVGGTISDVVRFSH